MITSTNMHVTQTESNSIKMEFLKNEDSHIVIDPVNSTIINEDQYNQEYDYIQSEIEDELNG